MVRLLLIASPAVALTAGISVSRLINKLVKNIKKPEKRNIPTLLSWFFFLVTIQFSLLWCI